MSGDSVKVAVRIRPLITRERDANSAIIWSNTSTSIQNKKDGGNGKSPSPYHFDRVFGMDDSTAEVFDEIASPIIQGAMEGFNGTIFAYGQTSSGKTFTMMGNDKTPGIIPQVIETVFETIENTEEREYLIRVSYIEIYNEQVTDLLSSSKKSLEVREDNEGKVFVTNLTEELVSNKHQIFDLMKAGDASRHVGATNMNEQSSRSHAIFRLIIESRVRDQEGAVMVSHVNLVDLAGSEKAKATGASGTRLQEGGFINRSLFILGNVISQLSDGNRFVSYRDSRLTRILQNSLGGNSKTAIICNISPAVLEETHSSLRFATNAKRIKNKPVQNEVLSDEAMMQRYKKEIDSLKKKLQETRNVNADDIQEENDQLLKKLAARDAERAEQESMINRLKDLIISSSTIKTIPITPTSKVAAAIKRKARRETWCPGKLNRQGFKPSKSMPTFEENREPQDKLRPCFDESMEKEGNDDIFSVASSFSSPEEPIMMKSDMSRFSNEELGYIETGCQTEAVESTETPSVQNELLAAELEAKDDQMKDLLERLKRSTEEVENLNKIIDVNLQDSGTSETRLKHEIYSLQEELKQAKETNTALGEKLNTLKAVESSKGPSRVSSFGGLDLVQQQLEHLRGQLEEKEKTIAEMEKEVQFHKQEHSEAVRLSEDLITDMDSQNDKLRDMENERDALQQQVKDLKIQMDDMKLEFKETEEFLNAERDLKNESIMIKQYGEDLVTELQEKLKVLERTSADSEHVILDINKKLSLSITELEDLRVKLVNTEKELQQLRNEKADFETLQEMDRQKHKCRQAELTAQLEEAYRENSELRTSLGGNITMGQSLDISLQAALAACSTGGGNTLEASMAAADNLQVEHLNAEITNLRQQLDKLMENLDQTHIEKDDAIKKLSEMKEELCEMADSIKVSREEKDCLNEELLMLKGKIASVEMQKTEERESMKVAADTEKQCLERHIEEVEAEKQRLMADIQTMRTQIETLETERTEFSETIVDSTKVKNSLEKEKKTIDEEKERICKMELALNDEKSMLEKEKTALKLAQGNLNSERYEVTEEKKLLDELAHQLKEDQQRHEEEKTAGQKIKESIAEAECGLEEEKKRLEEEQKEILNEREALRKMALDIEQRESAMSVRLLSIEERDKVDQDQRLSAKERDGAQDEKAFEIEEQQRAITERTHELEEREKVITVKAFEIEEQEKALTVKVLKLEEQEKAVTAKVFEIEEHEKTIAAKALAIEEQEKVITTKALKIEDKEKIITTRELEIEEQEKTITDMLSSLKEENTKLKEKQEKLSLEEEALSEKALEIDEQQKTITEKLTCLQEEKQMLEDQKASFTEGQQSMDTLKEHVTVLQLEKKGMEECIAMLENELKSAKQSAPSSNEQNKELQEEKQALESEYQKKVGEFSTLQAKIHGLETEKEDILSQLAENQKQISRLETDIDEQSNRFSNEKDQLLKNQANYHEVALAELKQEYESKHIAEKARMDQELQNQIITIQAEALTKLEEAKALLIKPDLDTTAMVEAEVQLDFAKVQLEELEKQLKDRNSELQEKSLHIMNIEVKIKNLEERNNDDEESISALQQEIKNLQSGTEEIVHGVRDERDGALKALEVLKEEFEHLTKREEELERQVEMDAEEIEHLHQFISGQEAELVKTHEQINTLEDQLAELKVPMQKATQECEVLETKLAKIQEEKEILEIAKNAFMQEHDQARALIDEANDELEEEKKKSKKLEAELLELKENVKEPTVTIQKATQECEVLETKLAKIQKEKEILEMAKNVFMQERDEARALIDEADDELEEEQKKNKKLEAELLEIKKNVKEPTVTIQKATQECEVLKTKLAKMQKEKEMLEMAKNAFMQERDQARALIDEADDELEEEQKKNKKLEAELLELKKNVKGPTVTIQKATQECEVLKTKLAKIQKEKEILEMAKNAFMQERDQARALIDEADDELEEEQKKNKKLEAELLELKKNVKEPMEELATAKRTNTTDSKGNERMEAALVKSQKEALLLKQRLEELQRMHLQSQGAVHRHQKGETKDECRAHRDQIRSQQETIRRLQNQLSGASVNLGKRRSDPVDSPTESSQHGARNVGIVGSVQVLALESDNARLQRKIKELDIEQKTIMKRLFEAEKALASEKAKHDATRALKDLPNHANIGKSEETGSIKKPTQTSGSNAKPKGGQATAAINTESATTSESQKELDFDKPIEEILKDLGDDPYAALIHDPYEHEVRDMYLAAHNLGERKSVRVPNSQEDRKTLQDELGPDKCNTQ